jgi:hypothetical protein
MPRENGLDSEAEMAIVQAQLKDEVETRQETFAMAEMEGV